MRSAPEWLEVRLLELPSHGMRQRGLQYDDLPPCAKRVQKPLPQADLLKQRRELVAQLAAEVAPLLQRLPAGGNTPVPYALYGFSFGSLLAYEIAIELRTLGYHPPLLLMVAGRFAPHAVLQPTRQLAELQTGDGRTISNYLTQRMGIT